MDYKDEKILDTERLERVDSDDSEAINNAHIDAFTPAEQKAIMRKIDLRLVPTLGFMYCVSLMDRTNLGIAVVAGMGTDLVLVGTRYSIIVLVFFITYVALQPPATVILRKLGPRVFLPSIVILWGLAMVGFGFVKKWTGMLPSILLILTVTNLKNRPAPSTSRTRNIRGWILPRLRLPFELLVSTLRTSEAQCGLLPDRQFVLSFLRYPSLWLLPTTKPWCSIWCSMARCPPRSHEEEPHSS